MSLPGANRSSSGTCDGPSAAAGDLAQVAGAFGMEEVKPIAAAAAPGKFCLAKTSPWRYQKVLGNRALLQW